MSWRIAFPEDQSEDVSFADGVVYSLDDVKEITQEYKWMLPQSLYAPSLEDVRLRAFVKEYDKVHCFTPEDYRIFIRSNDDTSEWLWRECTEVEVYALIDRGRYD
jgi:hypothetical protein